MNEIYNSKDLRAYADSHGPYMRLTGNIAPYGITIDLTTVPEDMYIAQALSGCVLML